MNMSISWPWRRALAVCCAAFLLCPAAPSFAADSSSVAQARQALEVSITRILNCIKNPDYVNPATRGPLRQQIEDEVLHIFDFREFSLRTVGQHWHVFTPEQQQRFSDAFADLLISTYLNKIDGYNGERVAYTGQASSSSDRTDVRTVITMKDAKKVPVAYRMLPKDGSWRVYDVLVEGVSLVKNYRAQFQDILNKTEADKLIERIQAKADEMRRQHAK